LPLHIIKQILNETEGKIGVDEIRTIHEVDEKLFQNMNHNSCFKSPTLEELVDSTALSLEDIKKLEKLGVLVPQEGSTEKKYREDDIQIVEILSKLRQTGFTEERGFSLDLIEMYRDLMDVLVKQEIQIFTTRLTGKISRDEVLRMAEAAIHLTSILMGLLRKQSIMKITHEFGNESSQRPPA
jgi:DNA-binding transcriptional MerR regulator